MRFFHQYFSPPLLRAQHCAQCCVFTTRIFVRDGQELGPSFAVLEWWERVVRVHGLFRAGGPRLAASASPQSPLSLSTFSSSPPRSLCPRQPFKKQARAHAGRSLSNDVTGEYRMSLFASCSRATPPTPPCPPPPATAAPLAQAPPPLSFPPSKPRSLSATPANRQPSKPPSARPPDLSHTDQPDDGRTTTTTTTTTRASKRGARKSSKEKISPRPHAPSLPPAPLARAI